MKEILRDFTGDIPAIVLSVALVYFARQDITKIFNVVCVWVGIGIITLCAVSFVKRIVEEITKE